MPRAAGDLESKQAEAARLKAEQAAVLKRLKLYESKILQSNSSGGKSLVDKAAEREAQLAKKQLELERRCGSFALSAEAAVRELALEPDWLPCRTVHVRAAGRMAWR